MVNAESETAIDSEGGEGPTTDKELEESSVFIQIRFVPSKALPPEITIPKEVLSVPDAIDHDRLNNVLTQLLRSTDDDDDEEGPYRHHFDFLLNGTLLRSSLKEAIDKLILSREEVIEVECDVATAAPKPQRSIPHDDWVSACVVSKDGQVIVTGSYDNTIHFFDSNLKQGVVIEEHSGPVKCLTQLSSDLFASGSHDQKILIVNSSGKVLISLRGHEGSVECIGGNQEGTRILSGGFDRLLKIWDAYVPDDRLFDKSNEKPDGEKKRFRKNSVPCRTPMVTVGGHKDAVTGVTWVDSSTAWTCSHDHTLRGWDLTMPGQTVQFPGQCAFTDIDYSQDSGLLLTASIDRCVRLWDPRSSEGSMVRSIYRSHKGWVSRVCWSPASGNLFASAAYDNEAKMWDVRNTTVPLFNLRGHSDKVLCMDWSYLPLILTGGADSALNVFSSSQKEGVVSEQNQNGAIE